MTGISPVYKQIMDRFLQNVGPKSHEALAKDSGIELKRLHNVDITHEEAVKLYSMVFENHTFLEATVLMDSQDFAPLAPPRTEPSVTAAQSLYEHTK